MKKEGVGGWRVGRAGMGVLGGRAGCSLQMGDKGSSCPGSPRSGWATGRLASWLVNVQLNTAVLSHSSPSHV